MHVIVLTSIITFLGGFGLLGKARIQPGGGLGVVTVEQKGTLDFSRRKETKKHLG